MRINNSQKILNKRQKIERELIEKHSVDEQDLAIYFDTTPSLIRRDLRTLGLESGNGNADVIKKLIQIRNMEITEKFKDGRVKDTVLMDYGLWRNPRQLENVTLFKPLYNKLTTSYDKKEKILVLLELGWNLEDVARYVKGLNNTDRKMILGYIHKYKFTPKFVKENDEEMNKIVRETLQYEYQKSVEREESYRAFRGGIFKSILNLTGVSETKMYEFLGKENYACKRRQILKDRKQNRNKTKVENEVLKTMIYKAWKDGVVTKNEIAEAIGVTRQTVYNWLADEEIREKLINLSIEDYLKNNILIESVGYINPRNCKRLVRFENLLQEKMLLIKKDAVALEKITETEIEQRRFG